MSINPSSAWGSIALNLIAAVIFAVVVWLLGHFRIALQRIAPLARQTIMGSVGLLFLILNILCAHSFGSRGYLTFFLISSIIVAVFTYQELNQFWRIGLVGADRKVEDGIDYGKSLSLCGNSLDFLGVGARKLTATGPVFDHAMLRCHREQRPIKFLLLHPESNALVDGARRHGQEPTAYREAVKASLRAIASLKTNRALNIEVRFYESLPIFRLLFIDDDLCLASHYVFGEGDGSQLPQLHVRRLFRPQRDVGALYHPFRSYFDRLWEDAVLWDFSQFTETS